MSRVSIVCRPTRYCDGLVVYWSVRLSVCPNLSHPRIDTYAHDQSLHGFTPSGSLGEAILLLDFRIAVSQW